MTDVTEATDRGFSRLLRMKRSLELSNEKKERLKRALASVKGSENPEYAAQMVKSAKRAAANQDSVVKRQIARIHEETDMKHIIESVVDADVASLEETIDAILRAKIDEALFGDEDEEDLEEATHLSRDGKITQVSDKAADRLLKGPKTKKEKKEALASYMKHRKADDEAHGGVKEDVDQIDELSKKTLASYLPKAADNMAMHYGNSLRQRDAREKMDRAFNDIDHNHGEGRKGYARKNIQIARDSTRDALRDAEQTSRRKAEYRYVGIERASKKLAKEDVEQVDELSKETLGSYATSRLMQRWRTDPKDKKAVKKAEKAEPYMKKAWKKAYGKSEG